MAGIHIAYCSQIFMVAAGKRGTGSHPACRTEDRPINLKAETHECVGFVHFLLRENLDGHSPEGLLRGGQDCPALFVTSSNIKQSEKHPVRTHTDEIVKISSHALSVVHRR